MRTSIEIAARKLLQNDVSRLTAQKQLGLDQTKSSAVIDRSLEAVIAELRKSSADEFKTRRLHAEISRADTSYSVVFPSDLKRASSLKAAGEHLVSMVGADEKARLSRELIREFSLTQSQADDALALVSPAIIDSIKTSLTDGSGTNDVAGLNAALKATGTGTAAKTTGSNATASNATASNATASTTVSAPAASTRSSTASSSAVNSAHTSAPVAGSTAVVESESSWLKRFGLPFFLLCGLILGSIKFCSEAEKSRVVTEERDQLQLNLAGAEEQNAKTSDELSALQGNFDESQSQIESLKGELQSVQTDFQGLTTEHEALEGQFTAAQDEVELNTAEINLLRDDLGAANAELQQLRDLPQNEADLQQQLIATMAELDIAREAEAAALEKLKVAEANRDKTQERNESLKFDVDVAQKNINSNATLISGFRSQVNDLSAQRDSADVELKTTLASLQEEKADVTRLNTEVRDLEDRIGEMTNKVEELDAEIVTLTELNNDLESRLQNTQTSLDSERESRQSDNTNFTAEAATLQEQLADLTSQRDTTEATLTERDTEITKLSTEISELQQQVENLETVKAEAADSEKLLNEQIAELEQNYDQAQKLIGTRDSSLAERASELYIASDKLGVAQRKVESLEKERDELIASIDELKSQAQSLISEKDSAVSEIESKDSQNAQLTDLLQSLETQSSQAQVEIDGLTQANAELYEELTIANALNDNLKANIDSLEEQNDKLAQSSLAFRQSLRESEQNIANLSEARDKLQSEVAATGAESKALETDANNARKAIEEKLAAAGFEDVQVNSTDDNRAVAITLGSNIIFSAGDVAMTRQGSKLLREVGRAISDYPDWRIDVEGHTDSLPIGEQLSVFYPSNWELSSARASAVINHLRFASGIKADSMSARGFADTQPVADNSSAQGREKNRRVDIVLRR